MNTDLKCYDLFKKFYKENEEFKKIIDENMNEKIRFFGEEEWDKIKNQNFMSPIPELKEFIDMFTLGYNIGNCGGTSRQLSYSYNDVDIVSGILPMLKGTRNAEKEGGHVWLENDKYIIDTSLMLIIDKSLKDKIGYIEEQRITKYDLMRSTNYQARKEFTNDESLKSKR